MRRVAIDLARWLLLQLVLMESLLLGLCYLRKLQNRVLFFAPHGGAENVDVDVDRDGRGAEHFRLSTGRWLVSTGRWSTSSGRRRPGYRTSTEIAMAPVAQKKNLRPFEKLIFVRVPPRTFQFF